MEINLEPTEWWEGKLTIEPTDKLWKAIKSKQFMVDDVFGFSPDQESYSDEEQVSFFIQNAVEEYACLFRIENPAIWVERELEALEVYEEYLSDLDEDRHQYTDKEYEAKRSYSQSVVESLRDDINCFCV